MNVPVNTFVPSSLDIALNQNNENLSMISIGSSDLHSPTHRPHISFSFIRPHWSIFNFKMLVLTAIDLYNEMTCQVSDKAKAKGLSLGHTSRRCIKFVVQCINSFLSIVKPYNDTELGQYSPQVIACCNCMTAPHYYLDRCWLHISKVPLHTPDAIVIEKLDIPSNKDEKRSKSAFLK